MVETNDVLDDLGNFNYHNLSSFQKAFIQRSVIGFLLNLMVIDKHNRKKYLDVLWRIPACTYRAADVKRLSITEPFFITAKLSRIKLSVLAIVDGVNYHYNQHTGELPNFCLEIFKTTWDENFQELKRLLFSNDKREQDLAFLFFMSINKEKLDRKFCQNFVDSHVLYAELVGRALILDKFKPETELLDEKELWSFVMSSIYSNPQRPIAHYYHGLMKRITPEQANSYLMQKISYRGFSRESLQNGVKLLKSCYA